MKQRKMLQKICSVILMLFVVNVMVLPVHAGSSEIVVDASTYETEISSALWKNIDDDVVVENGVIVFPNESTDMTGLITKTNAKSSDKHENLVTAKATIQFTNLPEGEQFAFALGLGSVEATMGEAGNIEVLFYNNGSLKAMVKVYTDDGDAEVVMEERDCGSVSSPQQISAVISNEQVLTLSINGTEAVNTKLPVSGEGRVGFLQSGSCGARVSEVEVVSYRYDNPENVNALEDFESGSINTNVWTSKMPIPCYSYFPTGTNIVQEDGNYVFKFNNSGCAYLGTKYQYSNFELTFDVPYLQRKHVQDEEGNIVTPKCENFAVSIGGEASDYNDTGYVNAADLIIFSGNSTITSWHTQQNADAGAAGYPYFSAECDKGFSVKISVIDSVITVGMKWIEEEEFTDIFQYQVTRETPLGYVHLWTTAGVANLAIDNLKIENKDIDPVLTEVEYKSGMIERPADFAYTSMERVYQEKEETEEFNWYLIPAAVAVVCVVAVAVIACVTNRKKKSRKGGTNHDEK